MPDEISGMGKSHGNASLICKKRLSSKSFEHYAIRANLNGYILGTYCLKFTLSIQIISILFVIEFILIQPDVSVFVVTDKHFRISDLALFCEFRIRFYFFKKYATLLLNNEHIPRTWRKN
jgi:hypothetical protein